MPALGRPLLSALALPAICAFFIAIAGWTPPPAPVSAPPTTFSAERALAHVRVISERPHPSGSADHGRVRAHLMSTLAGLGLQPEIQETTGLGTHNSVAGHVLNVIGRLPGLNHGGPAVLLAAHYDTVPAAPGAGDDGAAVAALLETVRALGAGPRLAHDVLVLFSDGEESGLTGAAAFVREHRWAKDVAVALNFEGRGTGGPVSMFETGSGNLDAVRVLRGVRGAMATSFAASLYRLLPNDTDVSEFVLLGRPMLNFGFAGGVERYHTASDDVAHLDAGSVQHHGELALALTRAFADGPLPRPPTGDAVFFNLPAIGLIVFPESFAMPLTIAAGLFVIIALVRARRRHRRWGRELLLGIVGVSIAAVIGIAVSVGVARVFDRLLGSPAAGASAVRGTYAVAIAMLAAGVSMTCWTFLRRRASASGLNGGALVMWMVIGVIVTGTVPGGGYLFAVPALAATIAAIASGEAVMWLATITAAAILVPAVYGVAVVTLGMIETGAVVIAVFVTTAGWLLARHVETLTTDRMPAAPIAFGSALVLLTIAAASSRPSASHPEPSMVAYAYDSDSSRAWLLTPATARPGSWARLALGSSVRIVDPLDWRTRAIAGEMPTLAADSTMAAVGVPEVAVAADRTDGQERRLELRVRPAAGTYSIRIRAIGAQVLASEVDGRPIDTTRYRSPSREWSLGYVAPQPDGFSLTLTVRADAPLELDVIARSPGLPASIMIPQRPDGVVPIHSGDQTVVHRRVRLQGRP